MIFLNNKNKKIIFKIYINFKKSIEKEKITIMYSGGVDSNFLLYIIKKIFLIKFFIIHINHNLNKLDKKYKNFCKKNLLKLEINFILININKKKNINKLSIENTLKIKRYKKTIKLCKIIKTKSIWIAHHKNDFIETFFIKLTKGFNKTFKKKNFLKIQKIRPIKNLKKIFIKKISKKFFLKWIEDKSNLKIYCLRNIIRIKILPKLKFFFKNFNIKLKNF